MELAIIQARTTSTRLPGKVLLKVLDIPIIIYILERVSKSKNLSKVILATSNDPTDDQLSSIVEKYGYPVFRGSLTNVLNRFYECAISEKASTVVRITGDCPLMDPALIDEILSYYKKSDFEYIGNSLDSYNLTVPDGFDIEVFSTKVLDEANKKAILPSELEHVTPWMRNKNSKINWSHFNHRKRRDFYRVTVDDEKDFKLVKEIIEDLYPKNNLFSIDDVISFLKNNPSLANSNKSTIRNEGLLKSLREDEKFIKKND